MQPVAQAVLRSWSIPPAATFAIVLSALIYLRGWWLLRRAGSPSILPWRAASFLLGLFMLWVALASPMDVFNGFVLTALMHRSGRLVRNSALASIAIWAHWWGDFKGRIGGKQFEPPIK